MPARMLGILETNAFKGAKTLSSSVMKSELQVKWWQKYHQKRWKDSKTVRLVISGS